MISIWLVVVILVAHFWADFVYLAMAVVGLIISLWNSWVILGVVCAITVAGYAGIAVIMWRSLSRRGEN